MVTPALDHIYTKAILDLSDGPVLIELPEVAADRYFSIQIADQEHYTIYDEIHPVGTYVFVRKGKEMEAPDGATVIESPGDYPHLFVRARVKSEADLPNVYAIQQLIKLTAASSNPALTIEAVAPKFSATGKNDLINAYNSQPNANGNITITFSVDNPEDGTYWIPVNAGEPYYFVTRYYKPDLERLFAVDSRLPASGGHSQSQSGLWYICCSFQSSHFRFGVRRLSKKLF